MGNKPHFTSQISGIELRLNQIIKYFQYTHKNKKLKREMNDTLFE